MELYYFPLVFPPSKLPHISTVPVKLIISFFIHIYVEPAFVACAYMISRMMN